MSYYMYNKYILNNLVQPLHPMQVCSSANELFLPGCHWWDIILTNSADEKNLISFPDSRHVLIKAPVSLNLHQCLVELFDGQFVPSKSTVPSPLSSASLTMASISLRLMCSPISLIMAHLSSSVVISPSPSMSNWPAGKKNSNSVCKTERRRRRKRFDSHLFKGISELLHANHPSCFFQQLWGHEVYKILKVNSATHWSEKTEDTENEIALVKNEIMFVKNLAKLTVHVDVLTQLDQLHLCGHVAHRSHEITQVFTADQSVLVLIKFVECITQLCGKTGFSQNSQCQNC